jgi:AdoMet-dependent rRNA methyltransferase SPB1
LNSDSAVDFEVVGAQEEEDIGKGPHLDGVVDAKEKEVRALIKAGFGQDYAQLGEESHGFEVVSAQLPISDERRYDSENEHYDSDDYATTLALGTMMLRKSKAKALVDASYNRYAWNDPEGLPDWFIDDEKRHYRPQLPIPPELLEKMKQKFLNLAAKPIAKVAEARARKQKRTKTKIAAAKKKAAAVASSNDMTETMKLKAISKAMRGKESEAPRKYVVSRKNGTAQGGKGIKLVDKRMKNDKRGMDRAAKGKKRSAKRTRR